MLDAAEKEELIQFADRLQKDEKRRFFTSLKYAREIRHGEVCIVLVDGCIHRVEMRIKCQ